MNPSGQLEKQPIQQGDRDIAVSGINGNRVMASISKTINLGNYESIKVEFGISRVVPDGESFEKHKEEVKTEAWVEITDMTNIVEEAME